MKYLLISTAVFFTLIMIHYLIFMQLKYKDERQPVCDQIMDATYLLVLSGYWGFVLWAYNNLL